MDPALDFGFYAIGILLYPAGLFPRLFSVMAVDYVVDAFSFYDRSHENLLIKARISQMERILDDIQRLT